VTRMKTKQRLDASYVARRAQAVPHHP
jgi:hypothetical protein